MALASFGVPPPHALSISFLVATLAALPPASAAEQVFTCPPSVIVGASFVGQAPPGWTGYGGAGPYGFKLAEVVNRNTLACMYVEKFSSSGFTRPWEAGATCSFAADKKTWNCVDATGATKSYPCPASMMMSAVAQSRIPDGWQGGGASGPFPFLGAEQDAQYRVLRCLYRVSEFTFWLTRPHPPGICSFDTGRMSWTCRSSVPGVGTVPPPVAPTRRIPGR